MKTSAAIFHKCEGGEVHLHHPLFYAAQGVRYRKLQVILTTVSNFTNSFIQLPFIVYYNLHRQRRPDSLFCLSIFMVFFTIWLFHFELIWLTLLQLRPDSCSILRFDKQGIDKLGKAGETVRVAPGYFRNHLMPKLLAVPNIDKYRHLMEDQRKVFFLSFVLPVFGSKYW